MIEMTHFNPHKILFQKAKKFDVYKGVASSFLFSQKRFAVKLTLEFIDVFIINSVKF